MDADQSDSEGEEGEEESDFAPRCGARLPHTHALLQAAAVLSLLCWFVGIMLDCSWSRHLSLACTGCHSTSAPVPHLPSPPVLLAARRRVRATRT